MIVSFSAKSALRDYLTQSKTANIFTAKANDFECFYVSRSKFTKEECKNLKIHTISSEELKSLANQ